MSYQENRSFRRKLTMLTISIGLVYFYFGVLKFFPNLSPAEQIGSTTVCKICFNLVSPEVCLFLLALLEVGIGICLVARIYLRATVCIALFHMVMTFTPFIFFPELIFQDSFISPSLLGQYIYKNLIIICALLVIYPPKETNPVLKASHFGLKK